MSQGVSRDSTMESRRQLRERGVPQQGHVVVQQAVPAGRAAVPHARAIDLIAGGLHERSELTARDLVLADCKGARDGDGNRAAPRPRRIVLIIRAPGLHLRRAHRKGARAQHLHHRTIGALAEAVAAVGPQPQPVVTPRVVPIPQHCETRRHGSALDRLGGCDPQQLLATGGLALPKTGSDGVGYGFGTRLGHSLVPTTPALVPLVIDSTAPRQFHAAVSGGGADRDRLLADTEGSVVRAYDMKHLLGTKRGVVVIDRDGVIRYRRTVLPIFRPTDDEVLEAIQAAL